MQEKRQPIKAGIGNSCLQQAHSQHTLFAHRQNHYYPHKRVYVYMHTKFDILTSM